MNADRLALLRRLSRVRGEQAGETVRRLQQALDEARREAELLSTYRRDLSIARNRRSGRSGHGLRTQAAFIGVAEAALGQAHDHLETTQAELRDALHQWAQARERTRIVDGKYQSAHRRDARERERRAEKDRPNASGRRRG